MAEKDNRYYWLKLKRDFFKRHDIQIIESMPNGKDYILFYLKLLCESVDHDGNLRFSERIPYSEQMLSTITNTNIDIVRSAIKVFTELQMMELLDDGTYFMSEVQRMIGSAVDNDNANRQRRYRERQKQLALQESYVVITDNNESKSKSKNEYMCVFEDVWKVYPRKINKGAAYKSYMARLNSGFSDDELMQATKNYADECEKNKTEQKYIKHASTFFGSSTPFVDYLDKNYNGGSNNGCTRCNDTAVEADPYADKLFGAIGG